jgi:hypothetical protein
MITYIRTPYNKKYGLRVTFCTGISPQKVTFCTGIGYFLYGYKPDKPRHSSLFAGGKIGKIFRKTMSREKNALF